MLEEYALLNLTSRAMACIYTCLIKLITSGSTAEPDLRKFLFSYLHGKERGIFDRAGVTPRTVSDR